MPCLPAKLPQGYTLDELSLWPAAAQPFRILDFDHWDLFEIWFLMFGIFIVTLSMKFYQNSYAYRTKMTEGTTWAK